MSQPRLQKKITLLAYRVRGNYMSVVYLFNYYFIYLFAISTSCSNSKFLSCDLKICRSLTSSSGLITPGFSKQNTQTSFGRSPATIQGNYCFI